MSSPLVRAFFIGRAIAETLNEQAERAVADALSELGKFDAEQRERMRQFVEEVMARAEQAETGAAQGRPADATGAEAGGPVGEGAVLGYDGDLQTAIDELRAETARLRSQLKQYRNESASAS